MKMSDTDVKYSGASHAYNKWMKANSGVCREWSRGGAYRYFFAMDGLGEPADPTFIEREDHETDEEFKERLRTYDYILAIEKPPALLRVFKVNAVVCKTYEYTIEVVASDKASAERYVEHLADNGSLDDESEDDCNVECESVYADPDDASIVDEDEAENYDHRAD